MALISSARALTGDHPLQLAQRDSAGSSTHRWWGEGDERTAPRRGRRCCPSSRRSTSRWSGSGPTWRRVYSQDGPTREARRPPSLSERLGGGAAIAPRPGRHRPGCTRRPVHPRGGRRSRVVGDCDCCVRYGGSPSVAVRREDTETAGRIPTPTPRT